MLNQRLGVGFETLTASSFAMCARFTLYPNGPSVLGARMLIGTPEPKRSVPATCQPPIAMSRAFGMPAPSARSRPTGSSQIRLVTKSCGMSCALIE